MCLPDEFTSLTSCVSLVHCLAYHRSALLSLDSSLGLDLLAANSMESKQCCKTAVTAVTLQSQDLNNYAIGPDAQQEAYS